jgi:hypothetical protein
MKQPKQEQMLRGSVKLLPSAIINNRSVCQRRSIDPFLSNS